MYEGGGERICVSMVGNSRSHKNEGGWERKGEGRGGSGGEVCLGVREGVKGEEREEGGVSGGGRRMR